ncbi:MAG: transketolase family protein [Clostridiales bacterium]|nr:transketolase family protein [Clostridiales bacterium]
MSSTREAYGKAIEELGEKYPFYVFDADLSQATKTNLFAKKYPDRFFQAGIAECNMMGMAAGFATCGATVFASTFAMFAAGRAFEQVRNSIAYPNLNVKIAATHAGILIGPDGGSHQCIEDISLMRTIPNMTVLCPSDAAQTLPCVEAAIKKEGPVYLRFGRNASPDIYSGDVQFEIGKGYQLRDGNDATIIAIGDMVYEALVAAEELSKDGVQIRVIDMPSLKPIDEELIVKAAKETGIIITAEDHNIIGGLGSAVCEVTAQFCPVPVIRVGSKDLFGRSGSKNELAEYYGLNSQTIIKAYNLRKKMISKK